MQSSPSSSNSSKTYDKYTGSNVFNKSVKKNICLVNASASCLRYSTSKQRVGLFSSKCFCSFRNVCVTVLISFSLTQFELVASGNDGLSIEKAKGLSFLRDISQVSMVIYPISITDSPFRHFPPLSPFRMISRNH